VTIGLVGGSQPLLHASHRDAIRGRMDQITAAALAPATTEEVSA
jgi:hypothetical protein